MLKESIYNAKYTVTTPEGTTRTRTTGFLAFGKTSFEDAVKFMNRPNTVVFKKIWCDSPLTHEQCLRMLDI